MRAKIATAVATVSGYVIAFVILPMAGYVGLTHGLDIHPDFAVLAMFGYYLSVGGIIIDIGNF